MSIRVIERRLFWRKFMYKKIMAQVLLLVLVLFASSLSMADTSYFDDTAYKRGDDTSDVKLIQIALYLDNDFDINELSTTFGPKTETAVKSFQSKYGLEADGVVGSGTMDKMASLGLLPRLTKSAYKMNDEGSEVRFIQVALIKEGLLDISAPTTSFATMTEKAVIDFQKQYDLTADGIVGEQTIQKLNALGYTKSSDSAEVATENLSDDSVDSSGYSYAGSVSTTNFTNGMSSDDCIVIQKALASMGFLNRTDFTNVYDDETAAAVEAFQNAYHLEADGLIGPSTFSTMQGLGVITYDSPNVVSRGDGKRYGEYLDWFKEVLPMAKSIYGEDYRGKINIVIEDFYTGTQINALFSYGHNHMDIEPLTKADTEKIKKLWNYNYSWTMRPVLVYYLDHVVAGSLAGMPHAASTLNRIKDNGMSGVLDLHFKNSRTHATNKIDNRHQKQIKISAGITK